MQPVDTLDILKEMDTTNIIKEIKIAIATTNSSKRGIMADLTQMRTKSTISLHKIKIKTTSTSNNITRVVAN